MEKQGPTGLILARVFIYALDSSSNERMGVDTAFY